jgi:hypothetical protein
MLRSIGHSISLAMALAMTLGGCQSSDVSRALGARCDVSNDCDDRCLQPSNDYPDGFCTLTCETDDDCPSSSSCVTDEGGVCLFGCIGDTDCEFLGDGWTCMQESQQGSAGTVMVCKGTP